MAGPNGRSAAPKRPQPAQRLDAAPGDDLPGADVPPDWKPRAKHVAELLEIASSLPTDPGVYIMRDRKGRIVYVGKALRIRQRVGQYFNGQDTRGFVEGLGDLLGDIETIVTTNNKEAMLLENTLIKRHQPRFNVKLRDDKQYLMLRLDPATFWPRLEVVRKRLSGTAQHFGPFHSAASARATLRVINRHFQLRTCSDFVLRHRKRPCLQYQIGRCPAPCVHEVDKEQYGAQVKQVGLFLSGRHRELAADLKQRMESAAQGLAFETAARIRDQLKAIKTTLESQRVVSDSDRDQDAIGYYREGGQVEFFVLHVRHGKVMATQSFSAKGMELPNAEVLHNFVSAYYEKAPLIPHEVILPHPLAPDDDEPLRGWLSERKGRKVDLVSPERGPRAALARLAGRNARNNFSTRRNRDEDLELTLRRIHTRLRLSRIPQRIECFDISHIQGSDPVGSMVVFIDGVPDKSKYRRFKIKGISGLRQGRWQNDDFASMYEVLTRRIRHALDATDEDWALPDLFVIDGGKGQLGRVIAALTDMGVSLGVEGVDVVALAKERSTKLGANRATLNRLKTIRNARYHPEPPDATDATDSTQQGRAANRDEDRTRPSHPGTAYEDLVLAQDQQTPAPGAATDEQEDPRATQDLDDVEVRPERVFVPNTRDAISLRSGSSELFLMMRIRDEAHRFAIGHHRLRRQKRALRSSLDHIVGVGPGIKKALIQHFGTIAAIREASTEALAAVPKVGPSLAERIRAGLRSS
ncbi:MAG: excinuclease ABC subunit UvrC [Nannocystaceae bacterium]